MGKPINLSLSPHAINMVVQESLLHTLLDDPPVAIALGPGWIHP